LRAFSESCCRHGQVPEHVGCCGKATSGRPSTQDEAVAMSCPSASVHEEKGTSQAVPKSKKDRYVKQRPPSGSNASVLVPASSSSEVAQVAPAVVTSRAPEA